MYNPILAAVHGNYATGSYKLACIIAALLCIIELIRVVLMMHAMLRENVANAEKLIYNCMMSAATILVLLIVRCLFIIFGLSEMCKLPIVAILNFMPIMIFVYLLRLSSRIMWIKLICDKYNIPRRLINWDKIITRVFK